MLQDTLFRTETPWRPSRLANLPQDWSVFPRMGYDVETRDEQLTELGPGVRRGAYIVGFCLGFEAPDGTRQGHYLPIRHLGGDNMDEGPEAVVRYVAAQAARYRGAVVGAKLDYDLDFSAELGIEFHPDATFKDVQVAEPLIDELQYTYGLDAILERHGLEKKDERVFQQAILDFGLTKKATGKNPKAHLWKMPARYTGAYGERDVVGPLELIERQEAVLAARGLERIWTLEQAVTPVLVRMRRRGVRVDNDQLDRMEAFSLREEGAAWAELQRLTGYLVSVGDGMKAEVIAKALDRVDILPGRTAQGKPSITKEWLEALDHPVGLVIRRARKMSQLRTTFVASVRAHQVNGRVHCTFNQIVRQTDEDENKTEGAAYGRLSCVDPNLQQQPARDPELGPEWRKVYLPDEGEEWNSGDYSQQEPRLAVHAAVASGGARIGARAYESALAAAEQYKTDRSTDAHTLFCTMVHPDFGDWEKARAKQTRTIYKNIYLGICYGEGEPKMCRELGLPTRVILNERTGRHYEVAGDEGKAILDMIDKRVPYVKATARAVEKVAKARGYIVTMGGRQLHFPKDQFGNYDFTHKAFNRFIQGTAADQTKTALVVLDRAGIPLQLQVHDELVWSSADRGRSAEAARMMEECFPLNVPSKVDLEIGPSWGQAK
jgi:DNA polymerase I-like protein with 3'-5' exonuclease and polymerase domains